MAVHGIYIREIHNGRLVAQMLQRHICKVEMHPFDQKVGRHKHIGILIRHHGTIIAHSCQGGIVDMLYILGQPVDKPELTKGRNFSLLLLHHIDS